MGVAGLILGILGMICAFIPGVNLVSWIFPLIGIVLSAIGMSNAKKLSQPSGISVAGLVLSIVSFLIALPMFLCTAACASAASAASFGL